MMFSKKEYEIYDAVLRGENTEEIASKYGVKPWKIGYTYRNVLIYLERTKDPVWQMIYNYTDTPREATSLYKAIHTFFCGQHLTVKKILSISPETYAKFGRRIGTKKKNIIKTMILDMKKIGGENDEVQNQ